MKVLQGRWLFVLLAVVTFALALTRVRAVGDSGEYLLMARAISSRVSLTIRASDVAWLAEREPALAAPAASIARGISNAEFAPGSALQRGRDGGYRALHFWMYSLLSVPFLWLLEAIGARPLLALAATNATCVLAAVAYMARAFRSSFVRWAGPALFLACGSTFYLTWPGPEAMTAAAVLIAAVAAARGDLGLGILATGLSATQNPSTVGMLPVVLAGFWALRQRTLEPLLAEARPAPMTRREIVLISAGVLLILLPYAYFATTFSTPNLLAAVATDSRLVTFSRAWSMIFDLNQGMVIGVPGLFLGLVWVGALVVVSSSPRRLVVAFVVMAASAVLIAAPVLSTHNWNSGCIVFMRYAYWALMPLLAALLLVVAHLGRQALSATLATLGLQSLVVVSHGVTGDPVREATHGALARAVMRHSPAAYNPVPEIFNERTWGKEAPLLPSRLVAWPLVGRPSKVLVHVMQPARLHRICPGRQRVESEAIVKIGDGWRYLNAPLSCRAEVPGEGPWWFGEEHPATQAMLGHGWSHLEAGGVWTVGDHAVIELPLPHGGAARTAWWSGKYYGDVRGSLVSIAGAELGVIDLSREPLPIPSANSAGRSLRVELTHIAATSPRDHGESMDARRLGFFVRAVGLE